MNEARGLHGVGSHDRRKLLLVTGMDHLRVDVLLRCCRVYASSRVVWRLRNRADRRGLENDTECLLSRACLLQCMSLLWPKADARVGDIRGSFRG
jgi:hypothetical protein